MIETKKDILMTQAQNRGIKMEHLTQYLESESIMDFDLEMLINRMITTGMITEDNGYFDVKLIKQPDGINAVKKRRTEAELDQMKDV